MNPKLRRALYVGALLPCAAGLAAPATRAAPPCGAAGRTRRRAAAGAARAPCRPRRSWTWTR
jgi:hypothetical protein